jgi:hypothetical protein
MSSAERHGPSYKPIYETMARIGYTLPTASALVSGTRFDLRFRPA